MRERTGWFVCVYVGIVAGMAVATAEARPPRVAPGEKFALLVGVREYDPNELRPLPFAEPDAGDLAKVLRDSGYQRVVLMTQAAGASRARALPLGRNIRAELKGLLEDRDPEDSVVVVLIGHGVQIRGDRTDYFCPMDARLADKSTLIAFDEVYRDLEQCAAGVKVLLVDACRNDPQSDNSRSRSVVRLESVSRPQARRPPGGVAALFSCSEGEKSYEDAGIGHGVFSHFLIRGLKGEADLDRDGSVEVEELAQFAKKRVPNFVKDLYGPEVRQMPVMRGEIRGLPVLVSVDRPRVPDIPIPPTPRSMEPDAASAKVDSNSKGAIGAAKEDAKSTSVKGDGTPKMLSNSLGMKLALIPAGEFLMGATPSDRGAIDHEKPRHRVRISRPFYLDIHEVTQGQYKSITGENPSKFSGSEDLPVDRASWDDAIAFCNKLSVKEGRTPYYRLQPSKTGGSSVQISGGTGYRLPTEAEWEYACRAGTTGIFNFGDDPEQMDDHAWSGLNSGAKTQPVGQKPANAFGLHDMHGNMWEWCWDWYNQYTYTNSLKNPNDPTGPSAGSLRVLRGGCWWNDRAGLRASNRLAYAPTTHYIQFGFRVARDAE